LVSSTSARYAATITITSSQNCHGNAPNPISDPSGLARLSDECGRPDRTRGCHVDPPITARYRGRRHPLPGTKPSTPSSSRRATALAPGEPSSHTAGCSGPSSPISTRRRIG
jgi:hypothetical protein